MYVLLGGQLPVDKKLYEASMATAAKHLFFRPMIPDDVNILVLDELSIGVNLTSDLYPHGQHLGCFVSGIFAL